MSDRDENLNFISNRDRQKVTGSNLNVLDLQWELLSSEGGCWEADRVMETLAIDNIDALEDLRSQQEIIGLWWQNRYLYPAWQFGADGEVLPGLVTVLTALSEYSDWQKLQFLLSPNSRLDDEKMPLDELKAGNIEAIMSAISE
jgi:hypothetical protein